MRKPPSIIATIFGFNKFDSFLTVGVVYLAGAIERMRMKDFPRLRSDLEGDRLLRILISFLGGALNSFGLTVAVGGVIFSGLAISRDEWIEAWLNSVREAGPAGNMLAVGFEAVIETSGLYVIDDDLPEVDAPTYLHMKDVKIHRSDIVTTTPLWRIRLSEVSAWSTGFVSNGPME